MSYLAVLGILTGFPLLQTIWRPRWRVIRYFWQLTVVTFLAQMAVAPLSIFYFDQFPGLFMLSNWVILPFFSVLLALSFGVCILSLSLPYTTISFIYSFRWLKALQHKNNLFLRSLI
jgi:competence protein ComEC